MLKWISKLPLTRVIRQYNRSLLSQDIVAGLIVAILVIPQSLAFSILAGLPPAYGLYASITPTIVYALLGSSSAMAVGPVAITSIMTASALHSVSTLGVDPIAGAVLLAFMSGLFLLILGVFRFGFISHFLSQPVVTAFVTASGLIIALSQIKHLTGMQINAFTDILSQSGIQDLITNTHVPTLTLGLSAVFFLSFSRKCLNPALIRIGIAKSKANYICRIAPFIAIVMSTMIVAYYALDQKGIAVIGNIPTGIGQFHWPEWNWEVIQALTLPSIFIAIIGYISSISVSRTLASRKLEKIIPNQELIALGSANIASGLMGAFPISGGFTRSVINFDAGAATQIAGLFTAVFIAIISLFLTDFFFNVPIAMLAATILVSASSLIDFSILPKTWKFSKKDFSAAFITIVITLIFGVEAGVGTGIIASILLHFYQTSKPYVAEIGLVPGTRHFRNILHFDVETNPEKVVLRFDESFIFTNTHFIEEYIEQLIDHRPEVRHIILHCGAVNTIDFSGMNLLFNVNTTLKKANVRFHLSDLKTPLQKNLAPSGFFDEQYGKLYLNVYDAYTQSV